MVLLECSHVIGTFQYIAVVSIYSLLPSPQMVMLLFFTGSNLIHINTIKPFP
jgi:hypothetical protein